MCKLFAVSDARDLALSNKTLNIIKDVLCERDRDGFGYSALGEKGLFGERSLDTTSRFKSRFQASHRTERMPFIERTTNRFGRKSPITGSFVAHGRMSTNTRSLECTHPYISKQTALIHNGVVVDLAEKPIKTVTDNDTEILLNYWVKGGLEPILKNVGGYYAMAIQDGDHLHMVRDDRAKLVCSWSPTLDSWIFATNADLILDIARACKWKVEAPEKVRDNVHFALKGNEVIYESSITPRKAEISAAQQALSLGSVVDTSYRGRYDSWDYNDGSLDLVKDVAALERGESYA